MVFFAHRVVCVAVQSAKAPGSPEGDSIPRNPPEYPVDLTFTRELAHSASRKPSNRFRPNVQQSVLLAEPNPCRHCFVKYCCRLIWGGQGGGQICIKRSLLVDQSWYVIMFSTYWKPLLPA